MEFYNLVMMKMNVHIEVIYVYFDMKISLA